jgi:hypothetical protein
MAPDSRLYVFAGGQHGPARFPPTRSGARNPANFNDYHWSMRCLLKRLHGWVARDQQPPDSVYPTLRDKTLVALDSYGFPRVNGAATLKRIHTPAALDFGPKYREEGIITNEHPTVLGRYAALVPQADPDGNDLGGVRMAELQCPLASWTGWNLRPAAIGAEEYLRGNLGSYLVFPADRSERLAIRDSRPSILERFAGEHAYIACVDKAASRLADSGFLLRTDIPEILEAASRHWRWRLKDTEITTKNSFESAQERDSQ